MRSSQERISATIDGFDRPPPVEQLLDLAGDEMEPKPRYRIGELASEFNVTLRSLRFYEARGLLQPERRGTTRLYSPVDRRRLRLILLCKLVGFSLLEIRQIVDTYLGTKSEDHRMQQLCQAFKEQRCVLREQRADLDASIAALERSITALDS